MPRHPHTPFDQPPPGERPEPDTLIIEDQSLAYGFIQLPKQVLWARNLSRDAKMLYAVLLGYAWQEERCFPGYGRLCEDMGASDNFVRKCMRELQVVNLLRQKRRGLGLTNIYALTDLRTADLQFEHNRNNSRTSPDEVLEPHQSRTSRGEVPEPTPGEVPEPTRREVKLETVEKEAVKKETDNSNIRKATMENKKGANALKAGQTEPFSKIRSVNISEGNREGDIPHKSADSVRTNGEQESSSGDMSHPGGVQTIGAALLQRRRGRPSTEEAEARRVIREYVEDFGRELGDAAPKSSVTRAVNLMQEAGVSLGVFVGALQDARKTTQQRTASIQKAGEGGMLTRKNKMAYFFSVLEDELGLREPTPIDFGGSDRPRGGSSRAR